jgi:hypothetical protein
MVSDLSADAVLVGDERYPIARQLFFPIALF